MTHLQHCWCKPLKKKKNRGVKIGHLGKQSPKMVVLNKRREVLEDAEYGLVIQKTLRLYIEIKEGHNLICCNASV